MTLVGTMDLMVVLDTSLANPKKVIHTYSTCILCVIHINSSLPTINKISKISVSP